MDNNMANSVTAFASQLIHLGSISDTNHKWTIVSFELSERDGYVGIILALID